MKTLLKLIVTAVAGVGAFYAVHLTSAEKTLITFLTSRGFNPGNFTDIYLAVPLAAGLATVATLMLFWWVLSLAGKGRAADAPREGEPAEESSSDLFHTLEGHVKQYSELLTQRSGADDDESIYTARSQDCDFLEAVVVTLGEEKEAPEPVMYESGIRPDFLINEVRKLLQETVYIDFQNYYGSIHHSPTDTELLDWDNFAPTMMAIGKLSASLKECLRFYLNMCKAEKDKFSNLKGYNLLPTDNPNPEDAFLYMLAEEKQLGESFNYQSLFDFRKVAGNIKISMNPSIPDTYLFIDSYISGLYETISVLLKKGKHLFKFFQITREKFYQRMVWIIDNLETVNAESATYYKNSLARQKEKYTHALRENGFDPKFPPPELLSLEAINDLRKNLERIIMSDKGSSVIYETGTHRKSDQN